MNFEAWLAERMKIAWKNQNERLEQELRTLVRMGYQPSELTFLVDPVDYHVEVFPKRMVEEKS